MTCVKQSWLSFFPRWLFRGPMVVVAQQPGHRADWGRGGGWIVCYFRSRALLYVFAVVPLCQPCAAVPPTASSLTASLAGLVNAGRTFLCYRVHTSLRVSRAASWVSLLDRRARRRVSGSVGELVKVAEWSADGDDTTPKALLWLSGASR